MRANGIALKRSLAFCGRLPIGRAYGNVERFGIESLCHFLSHVKTYRDKSARRDICLHDSGVVAGYQSSAIDFQF